MAFRANEASRENFNYYLTKLSRSDGFTAKQKEQIEIWLDEAVIKWGPIVESYPSWHPLVSCGERENANPINTPSDRCGYPEIDHVVYFRDAFLTCPYSNGNELIQAVEAIKYPACVEIEAKKLEIPLYAPNATPILVTCRWNHCHQSDQTISQRCAVALMLSEELRFWHEAQLAERWETMRPYLLGRPCGSKSSLFVNQSTGQAMKKAFEAMVMGGTFGPLRLD